MIVKWRSDGPERFVTEWRGMALSLVHLPVTGKWGMTLVAQGGATLECNGLPGAIVRQHWDTARQAMDAVDAVMDRVVVVRLAAQGVVATQRRTTLLKREALHA